MSNTEDPSPNSTAESVVQKFLTAYEDPQYQDGLDRLYKDCGNEDKEEWARKIYITFRDDPLNTHIIQLNQDRKNSLALLYSMVDEGLKHNFPIGEYENAILKVFGVSRLKRILHICLIMDKCQALYKMELRGTGLVGMHWFCSLHVNPDSSVLSNEDLQFWRNILSDYSGTGTMNKRLYFLINSNVLNLQEDKLLAKWSKPEVAFFVKKIG